VILSFLLRPALTLTVARFSHAENGPVTSALASVRTDDVLSGAIAGLSALRHSDFFFEICVGGVGGVGGVDCGGVATELRSDHERDQRENGEVKLHFVLSRGFHNLVSLFLSVKLR